MIAKVNVDKNPRETGSHLYELRINHTTIGAFFHYRERSLGECLRRAATTADVIDAVNKKATP